MVAQDPQKLLNEARSHWRQWIKHGTLACDPLPDEIEEIYHRSLLVMMTQTDHEGAILAATDSDILRFGKDTYNYCWPRDAALIAHAYSTAGYPEVAANFFRFGARVVTPDGFFTHKYNPDGSPGSSWLLWFHDGEPQWPVQEDETALVVWALWKHYELYKDDALLKELYTPFVTNAVNWMIEYRDERGLPQPSYDLWEERRGVFTFTETLRWCYEDWDFLLKVGTRYVIERVAGASVVVRLRDDGSNMSSVMRPERIKAARGLQRRHGVGEIRPKTFWDVAATLAGSMVSSSANSP